MFLITRRIPLDPQQQAILDVVSGASAGVLGPDGSLLGEKGMGAADGDDDLLSGGGAMGGGGGAEGEADWAYDPNEPRYCVCNQVSYGDMVACDNDDVSDGGINKSVCSTGTRYK